MKKRYIAAAFFSFIILIFAAVLVFWRQNKEQRSFVCFEDRCFNVELALTGGQRERGLTFRGSLDSDKGMLFIFQKEGDYPFWMKNTLIPLDIIWFDKNKEAVFISKNVQPCLAGEICYPVSPNKKAQYVLELNAGASDKIGLAVGDRAVFKSGF